MSEQATLFDAAGIDDPEQCAHPDADAWPVPGDRHMPDGHRWSGLHPIYCPDCREFVDRVEADDRVEALEKYEAGQ